MVVKKLNESHDRKTNQYIFAPAIDIMMSG